jgi:hypothetical protein
MPHTRSRVRSLFVLRPERSRVGGNLRLVMAALVLTLACGPAAHAQTPGTQLAGVLNQMNASSKAFQSAAADFEWDFYERVVRDTTKQKGNMFIERTRGGITFGADVFDLDPSGNPQKNPTRIVSFEANSLRLYTPEEHQVDLFKSGTNQGTAESYLSLGFGGSGDALSAAWNIADGGPETLSDNGHPVKTEKLILTSKDPGVRSTFTRVLIWIDPARDVSLKQVFETPSGDQRTAFYSNIRLNSRIDKNAYKIPTKGVTVVPH